MTATEIEELVGYLSPEERAEFEQLLATDIDTVKWRPLSGPQTLAYYSEADVIGFGGAAGGGKTDLACGLALNEHHVVQFFRREGTELTAIIDRMTEIVGHRDGLGGKPPVWRDPLGAAGPHLIEFASAPNLGDERKFQGRAKDLLVVDEATNLLAEQVRFIKGWVRSTREGQRKRTLLTFNPPTSTEGRWVIEFFAPWLDPKFAGPGGRAQPGELRYVVVVPGSNGTSRDKWVEDGRQCVVVDGKLVYDFDPAQYKPTDIITPETRTFIPSRITDNPYLVNSGYLTVLQSMPEPLRSQMLYGDFNAGMQDDAFQVIPTAWIEAAQRRWSDRAPRGEMSSLGVDVARGGKDDTVIAMRHGAWIAPLKYHPGKGTPDGQTTSALVLVERRDSAPIHIDGIGVGSSPYDFLRDAGAQVISVNVSESSAYTGRAGNLQFANLRSELWWRAREWLDPANDTGAALPPDTRLATELATPKWRMQGKKIMVESREEIVKDIGRSPDAATAVILSLIDTPNIAKLQRAAKQREQAGYDPVQAHHEGRAPAGSSGTYDPLAQF